MTFIPNVDPAVFDAFVRSHPTKSHFMQSAAWGEFSQKQKGLTPHYVGLADARGALCAAALLLERKPPLFPKYFYCPRGFVVDFFNKDLLKAFCAAVQRYVKQSGAMFLVMDPDVERRAILADGSADPDGFDNSALVDELIGLGFRHGGFNMGFEGRQPRFTFRIDLTPDEKTLEKNIVGNVMKNVRKSRGYAVTVEKGTSAHIPDLHRLISLTGERDRFVGYDESYYQNFFDVLAAHDMAHLYIGKADPVETVVLLKRELAAVLDRRKTLKKEGPLNESLLTEQRLLREIALFEGYAQEFGGSVILSAHLVVRYGDKAWAVHAGSDTLMRETFLNNRVYYEKIMDQKRTGAAVLDQFGTVGDPETNPLRSLHEFKRQFGGRYMEFIGAFTYVARPFFFWLYDTVLPFYRSIRITHKLRRNVSKK